MPWNGRRAIGTVPKASYLTTLGAALLRLESPEEAFQAFDKAVQLKPDDADLWRHKGNALFKAGRSGEALPCFQRAVELNPVDADSAYRTGVLLKEEGRLLEALGVPRSVRGCTTGSCSDICHARICPCESETIRAGHRRL
jgi:Flp pilus assembly protein TadD